MYPYRPDLSKKENEYLEECRTGLPDRFDIEHDVGEPHFEELRGKLASFQALHGYDSLRLFDTWGISDGKGRCGLVFFELEQTVESGGLHGVRKTLSSEFRVASLVRLSRDFGRVLMRPERLSDKIAEVFRPREIDFAEHPDFSEEYYVVAEDEDKLRDALNWAMMDAIARREGLIVEVNGHDLLATRPGAVERDATLLLAELGCELSHADAYR